MEPSPKNELQKYSVLIIMKMIKHKISPRFSPQLKKARNHFVTSISLIDINQSHIDKFVSLFIYYIEDAIYI